MQRERLNNTHVTVCPACGGRLSQEKDLWVCAQHGAFFAYGPHLLVRAPANQTSMKNTALPWEKSKAHAR